MAGCALESRRSSTEILQCHSIVCRRLFANLLDYTTAVEFCISTEQSKAIAAITDHSVIPLERISTPLDFNQLEQKDQRPAILVCVAFISKKSWSLGVYINGSAASDGGWYACQGDCIAVNLNTTLSGQTVSAAVYSCDPTVVCRGLGVLNRCHNIEPGLQTCCCDTVSLLERTQYV